MKRPIFKLFAFAMALALMLSVLPAARHVLAESPSELFFSEYIEGSSNNKALEIYNGTGTAVDLVAGGYKIQMFSNGNTTASVTIYLTGTVADGDVYVVAHSSAVADILAQADQTNGAGWYNGNDAVVLSKGATALDVIGQIGFDPVTEWGTGLVSTADNTLRRMVNICTGDPDGSNAFDPAVEWDGYPQNTFDGLGEHTSNCGGGSGSAVVIINEVDSDTPSTDVLEFVELYDGGVGNIALDGLVVVFYNGSNDLSYASYDMDGFSTDANGYFVLGNAGVVPTPSIIFSSNFLQNGADAVALFADDAANFPINTAVTTTNLLDAIVYDTDDADDAGLLDLLNAGQPQVNENGAGDKDNQSNQRCANGSGGPLNTDTYAQFAPTPGTANCEVPPPPPEICGDAFTPIYAVQGNGAASPLVGIEVAIEGIVVGDFQNNASTDNGNLNGFHVQDPAGDGDPATSDGVFVYASGGMDVSVGDAVRVRGSVSEYYGLTEISASQVWLCSTGNPLPVAASLSLPVTSVNAFEAYEGMLVTFPQVLYISEYFNFDRYGEIVLTSQRHLTPTAEFEPGPDAIQAAQDFLLDSITLDDGRSTENPDPAIHPNGNVFDLSNLFRGGDILNNVTGVMDYSFSLYRIQPTRGADYTAANPRPAQPEDVGGNLKVVSMNTLNYFSTIDQGTSFWICGPAQNMECRGADTPEEFARQRAKIFAGISAMNADVIGLLEIENNINDTALLDLVNGLNDAFGAGTYDYIHTGVIGTDAIKVALIYKPASVSLVGNYAILDSTVDPRFIDTRNRPVLAQTFMDNTTGGIFTVAVNHLKSKGSACDGDPDLGDGAGNCNITRTLAAQAEVDWLATDPTNSGDSDFLIIGDLNSYDKEDPIDAFIAGPDDILGTADDYTDMVFQFDGEDAYSYVFDGQLGYLDYALASASLASQITGVTEWHVNADEPDLIDYDMTFKLPAQDALYAQDPYRYSDHDPVIIGLAVFVINDPPTVNAGGPYTVDEGSSVMLTATGTDPEGQPLTYAWDLDNNGTFETPGESVTFTGVDGPATPTVNVQVTDNGGLMALASAIINVNNVAPSIDTPMVSPEPSIEGSSVTASATFSDPGVNDAPFTCTVNYGDGSGDLPGIVSDNICTGPAHVYPTFGAYTVTVSVTDKDGGTGSNETTHPVIFNWTGFSKPVDNLPAWNSLKAGSTVPVKFSLGGDKGLNIFAEGYPQSVQIVCDTDDVVGAPAPTANPGGSSISYGGGQYNYVWKTDKAWAGTCRQLTVKLIDGSEHIAYFQFK